MKKQIIVTNGMKVFVRLTEEVEWLEGIVVSVDEAREAVFVQTEDGEYQMDFNDYPKLMMEAEACGSLQSLKKKEFPCRNCGTILEEGSENVWICPTCYPKDRYPSLWTSWKSL